MSYVNAKQVALLETPMTEEQYQRFQSSLGLAFYAESSPSIDKTNPDFQAFYAANVQRNLDHIRNNAFVTIPLPEVTNDKLIEILMNHANFSFELCVEANV